MREEMRKQVLLEAEIRRQRKLQVAMKIADKADMLTKAYVMSKNIAKAARVAEHAEAIAAAESSRTIIEIAKQPHALLAVWKEQQALWEKQHALLSSFRAIGMHRFMERFSDSKIVTLVRDIVDWLRNDKAIGDELEEVVTDNLAAELHKQLGIKVLKTDKNLPLNRGNENGEIDLVVYCEGGVILLFEIKKTINNKKTSHFINNNARLFINVKGVLIDEKICGAIAYVNSRGNAVSFAKEQGLLTCRISEDGLVLVEPPNTQQLSDLRFASLDKSKTQKTQQKQRKKKLAKSSVLHEWISASKNSDGTIPAFKVKTRPTRKCRSYLKNFIDIYDEYRFSCNSSSLAEAVARGKLMPLENFVTEALLGWENIIDSNGVIIPFSKENATKLFKDYPAFCRKLALRIYKVWHNNLMDEAAQ